MTRNEVGLESKGTAMRIFRITEAEMHKMLVVTIGAAALAAAGCGGGTHEPSTATLPPVAARVATAEATSRPQRVELHGTVEAQRMVAVSSRVMAMVTAVRVKPGDTVQAGQVLVEIDPQTSQGQEAQARGALAQARAGLALAERNYERFKALQEKGAASELELDMARMQFEQASGAVQQASGAVEAASSVARESRVVAPFAGRVAAKLVEVGDLAAPGRPLLMLESVTGRRLALTVPENVVAASGLKPGVVLGVRIDSLSSAGELTGAVVEMSPGADPASHSYVAKVELRGVEVPTGLAGRAWVVTGSRSVVAVPREAVVRQGGLAMVALRDAAGKSRSRAVTTGETLADGRVEILSGLAGGEDVLVGISVLPSDGSPVEAQP